jgi:hypothetical protein
LTVQQTWSLGNTRPRRVARKSHACTSAGLISGRRITAIRPSNKAHASVGFGLLLAAFLVTRARVNSELERRRRAGAAERLSKALALWRARQPLRGTIAETNLREARAYGGPLPPTLGFLPFERQFGPASEGEKARPKRVTV